MRCCSTSMLALVSALACASCGKVPGAATDEPADAAPDAPPSIDAGPDRRSIDVGDATPILEIHVGTGMHRSPKLVGDRLYFLADLPDGSGLFVASRAADGFEPPSRIATDGWDGYALYGVAVSEDEREVVVEAVGEDGEDDLYRAVRPDRDGAFGPLERLALSLPSAHDAHPALAGNELFFVSDRGGGRRLYVATRPDRDTAFGAPAFITVGGLPINAGNPWLAPDGYTLYFNKGVGEGTVALFRAVRDGASAVAFHDERELDGLTSNGSQTSATTLAEDLIVFESNRPWSPTGLSLWQAPVCRGAECPPRAPVACDGGSSPDGIRCYLLERGGLAWADAKAACEARGMRLATVHSTAELDVLLTIATGLDRLWTGGNDLEEECNRALPGCRFRWEGGEPFLYAPWFDAVNPDNAGDSEDCIELITPAFMRETPFTPGINDVNCAQPKAFVCES